MSDSAATGSLDSLRNFFRSSDAKQCIKEYDGAVGAMAYEESCVGARYMGAQRCAEVLAGLLDPKEEGLILDLCAGTGKVGKLLSQRGFKKIHAHDGSPYMLSLCEKTGVYSDYFCGELGASTPLNIKDNTYSACAMAGGLCPSHVPGHAQDEIVRVIKPGGYFVNVCRQQMMEHKDGVAWRQHATHLELTGQWSLYGRMVFPDYLATGTYGIAEIYKVAEATTRDSHS